MASDRASVDNAAVVVGASGGIGAAVARALALSGRWGRVHGLSRSGAAPAGVQGGTLDLLDEASIEDAFAAIPDPIALVFVATGVLTVDGAPPERSLAGLDPAVLARVFAINTIGPALVAKAAAPRLRRGGRSVIAMLSARVGSIADNRLGGWYGYRASKAALNMMVRCAAIELSRTRPEAVCVALHPGTVDTALSRPFQRSVRPETLLTPDQSAARLLAVVDGLTPADSGGMFAYDGSPIPF